MTSRAPNPPVAAAPTAGRSAWLAAAAVGAAGGALWQLWGNATRGYIPTTSAFQWWTTQWLDPRAEAEHGLLILALSAWLLWRNLRTAPAATTPEERGAWSAAAALAGGLALHVVGFAAQQTRVSLLALLLFTWGVLRLGGGLRWGRAAAFPLGFMALAIPVGGVDEIGLPLRLGVVSVGETLAKALGIAVVRNGTQLVAPDGRFHYDVAAPCSGVNSLVALVALAALVGYLNFRGWGRRALIVGAALPLVFLGNVGRITAIVAAAQWVGLRAAEWTHTVMGYGVFVIVLGGVAGLAAMIRRRWPESAPVAPADTANPAGGLPRWAVAATVVGLAFGEMGWLASLAARPARGTAGVALAPDGLNPADLPAFIGTEWIGRRAEVTAIERDVLPPDTGFARKTYVAVADPARQVFLSVVLSGRDRSSIHRPELCLVAQGWTINGAQRQAFTLPAAGGSRAFPATVLRVRREVATPRGPVVVPQLVAYWFVGGETVVAAHGERVLRDAWNRLAHGRADRWAYVLAQTDAHDGEAAALARLQAVIAGALPTVQRPAGPAG